MTMDQIVRFAHQRAFSSDQMSGIVAKDSIITMNLVITDLINKGAPLSTSLQYTQSLVVGQAAYVLAPYIIDIWNLNLVDNSSGQNVYFPLERIDKNQYDNINNKSFPGRPAQYMLDRAPSSPVLYTYLTPSLTSYSFEYYAITRNYDVTALTENVDLSYRYTPALISGLAYYMLLASPKDYAGPDGQFKLQLLKSEYGEQLKSAFDEDRERTSMYFEMKLFSGGY